MAALLPLLLLGAVLYAASQAYAQDTPTGRRDGTRPPAIDRDAYTGVPVCDLPASQVAELSGDRIRAWLDCPGRRNTEVQQLATILYAQDPPTAGAVLQRWTARRNVETAVPTGEVSAPTRTAARAALEANDAELATPAYDPAPVAGLERNGAGRALTPPAAPTGTPAPVQAVTYNPTEARSLAGGLARHVRERGRRYDRARVRAFQRAAGFVTINQHGHYDCVTRNALAHFGVNSPPDALDGLTGNCASHPYTPPRS